MKPHKKHTPKRDAKLLIDTRKYLRANAPQVKFIDIDNLFTGSITTTERQDKGKKGYKQFTRNFKSLDELKKFYDKKSPVKKSSGKIRRPVVKPIRKTKDIVEKKQSKKRKSLRYYVHSWRARGKV